MMLPYPIRDIRVRKWGQVLILRLKILTFHECTGIRNTKQPPARSQVLQAAKKPVVKSWPSGASSAYHQNLVPLPEAVMHRSWAKQGNRVPNCRRAVCSSIMTNIKAVFSLRLSGVLPPPKSFLATWIVQPHTKSKADCKNQPKKGALLLSICSASKLLLSFPVHLLIPKNQDLDKQTNKAM